MDRSHGTRSVDRRSALKTLAAGGATTALASPAIAQSQPTIRWRLASSFPKSLDALYACASLFIQRVKEATDGKFEIQFFGPGEIVGALQVLDAVQNGTIECCHTGSYYFVGKDPAFAFACQVPFGLNARQQEAWLLEGGGAALIDAFMAKYNIVHMHFGNTGAQMGGWFRKEIKTVDDLKGLKFRIGGLSGNILQKLGVVPQQIAAGDIYPALERGTIDAAEWVSPIDDEKLGFVKVAKYYYYPGWWEAGPLTNLFINQGKWNELPPHYQAIVRSASAEASRIMLAKYDALNMAALRRLIGAGAELRTFSREILEASFKATQETMTELAAKSPDFKTIYEPWSKFRADINLWFSVSETPLDSFLQRALRT